MDSQVLVAYATKYGATAEIAEKIGDLLRQSGVQTDVLPADRVNDLSGYRAVVLGSGVYIGRWRKPAAKFLKENEQALAERSVWLFSTGPTGEGDPVDLLNDWTLPGGLQSVADRIQPRDITVFHGAVDPAKLNFIERWMIKKVKSPVGDYRDWDAIASWAEGIAIALEE